MTAFASEWKKDTEYGGYFWWYQRDDGYLVGENGAWVESVPQMTSEEMVKLHFSDPVEAEFVLEESRDNYTFVPFEYY